MGSGKSTVLDHLGDLLEESGTPFALVDLDWLHRAWPPPVDDPHQSRLELADLGSLTANLAAAQRDSSDDTGPHHLVLAGVLADEGGRNAVERAIGRPLTVVRLEVEVDELERRLRHRYVDPDRQRHLDWHLEAAGPTERRLRESTVADHVVRVDSLTPRQVAEAVLTAAGW